MKRLQPMPMLPPAPSPGERPTQEGQTHGDARAAALVRMQPSWRQPAEPRDESRPTCCGHAARSATSSCKRLFAARGAAVRSPGWKRTQFEPSRARPSPLLPAGWRHRTRGTCATYWFHVQTRQTTWTRPPLTGWRRHCGWFVARGMLVRRASEAGRCVTISHRPSRSGNGLHALEIDQGSLARRAPPRIRSPARPSRSSIAVLLGAEGVESASTHPSSRRASAKQSSRLKNEG